MRNTTGVFIFLLGAAAGVAASFKYWQKREKERADEEIASVIEAFDARLDKEATSKKLEELNAEIKKTIETNGYTNYSSFSGKKDEIVTLKTEGKEETTVEDPRIITPDEYWEVLGYNKIPYTYYSDGVLADENDERVSEEEIEKNLVSDFREHFQDYDPDTVYIRNDRLSCDYEITLDYRPYSQVVGE